jgi:hypothetical protein
MTFIASLKNGSYTAQMARARNLSTVSLGEIEFTWNGRQYVSGVLTDIPAEAQGQPQIAIAAMGTASSLPAIDPILLSLEAQEATIEGEIKAEKAKTTTKKGK